MSLRRSLSVTVNVLACTLLALAGVAGWLAFRLANDHPIHLRFLVPSLQRSLATADETIRFELEDIVLAWKPGEQPLDLWTIGLRGYAKDGHLVADIQQLGFSVSLPALLHGLVAPASIEVLAPAITLRREANGGFTILGRVGSAPTGKSQSIGQEIFDRILAPPDPSRVTGYLREVKIARGSLEFDDLTTGRTWHAPEIDLDLIRENEGMKGHLSAQLQELGHPAAVDADFILRASSRMLELKAGFRDIDVASLAALGPVLAGAAGLHMKVGGQIETTFTESGEMGALRFTAAGGSGSVDLPQAFAGPHDISKLSLAGSLQAGFDGLAIDSLILTLGDSVLEARAQMSGLASAASNFDRLRVKGDVAVRDLPISEIPRLWPLSGGQSSGARDWCAGRIDRGTVLQAQASFDLTFPQGYLAAPQILAFGGTFDATGVRLHYLRPLPPVEGAVLAARFDTSSLVVDVRSGTVNRLSIDKARVTIAALDGPEQSLDLDGDVSGSLRDALLLLDGPGLGYLHGTGIDPAKSAGRLSARLRLRLPLLNNLPPARIRASAKVRIEDAKLDNLVGGHGLSDGKFDLDLDDNGIVATGRAIVAAIPITLRWDENFGDRNPKTRISVRGSPNAKSLAQLGLNLHGMVQGSLPGEIVYRRFAGGAAELAIDADLTPSTIALDFARWHKAPGVPGRANATLALAGSRLSRITAFSLSAADAFVEGRGDFAEDGRLRQVAFDRLDVGRTKLNDVVFVLDDRQIDARVGGGEFDAEPYRDKAASLGFRGITSETATAAGNSPGPSLAYVLKPSHLSRVFFGTGREIDSLNLSFAYDDSKFQSIESDGMLLGGGSFKFRWLPADASTHQLSLTASDAGAALKALGIFDDAAGGKLTLTGTSQDGVLGHPILGHLEVTEYRLVRQSALLRLFTVATLTGIADMMTGDGLLMRRFLADFTKTYGRVDIPFARTYGPSFGVTAKGYFDFGADSIDIRGTAVPASALNSLVGSVPLVGFLLTGGKNNGIGSVTYAATGKLSEPTFSVNPLSALDPGFLKAIFDLPGAGANPADALPPGVQ